jgi:hypothetical protein
MDARFDEDRFTYCPDGIKSVATAGSATAIDYKITRSSMWISGGQIVYRDASFGDYLTFQVVDKDNVLGFGNDVVLNTFVTKWYLDPSHTSMIVTSQYAAELKYSGLYLRAIYTSVGETDVDVCINYDLHHF